MNATPLYDSALLYWNSSIVSYGGAPRDQPAAIPAALAQLYSLPPALASWTSVVDGPASTGTPWPALVAHSMHLVGPNTALILFGLTRIPSNTWSPSLDSFSGFLYTWDLAAMTIAARPTVPAIGTSDLAPQARGRHSSVFDKSTNTVWVWGGYSAFGPLVELWALDVQTAGWKRMPAPPAAPPGSKSAQPGAVGASMSMLGSSLVICFGSSGPSGSESAGCLLFDTRSHVWSFPSMLGQIPQPRRNSPMTAVSPNTAFIFSGRTASPAAPAKDAWTITISESDRSLSFRPVLGVGIPASSDSASASLVPSFRDGHASVAIGDTGNTFIFGGRAGDGASPADAALYVYSFATRSWVYATSPAISAPTRANQDGQPQRAPLDGSTQGAISSNSNSNSNSSTPGETMSTTTLILIAALGVAVLCAVGIIIFVQIRNNRSPARKTHDTGRSKGLTRKASNESARSSSSAASARSKRSSTLTADQVMTASMHSAYSQEAAVASAKGQSAAQAYLSTYSSPGSSSPVSQPSQQQQLQRPQLLITTEKSPRLYDAEMGSAVPVSGHEIISVSALAERMSMPRPQTPRSPLTPHAAQPKHQSMYGNMFNVYQPTPLSPQHASTPAVHQMAIVHPGGNGQRSVRGVSSAIDLGGGRSNAGGSGVRTRRLSVNAAAAAGMNPAVDHTGVSRPLLASPASAVSPSPYYASYGQMPVSQQRPMSTAVPITTTRPTAEHGIQPHRAIRITAVIDPRRILPPTLVVNSRSGERIVRLGCQHARGHAHWHTRRAATQRQSVARVAADA
ncbi:hypothetical protein BC831DRAFT_434879 [Entophlyctis helioformis]|nr:hypothetical protein BC831DRAFT_434879 [Entophlyctis helioformis]